MKLNSPLIINFRAGRGSVEGKDHNMYVPAQTHWQGFKSTLDDALSAPGFDYVMLTFDESVKSADADNLKALDIKINTVLKQASIKNLKVFNRFENQLYYLNAERGDGGKPYAPSDEIVLAKRDQFGDDLEWQHHQAEMWDKLSAMMPLSKGEYKGSPDHVEMLTNPSRGLSEDRLDGFFSWRSGKTMIPGLLDDNLVGMPSFSAYAYEDISLFYGDKPVPGTPIAVKSAGVSGAVIPMRNEKGDMAKFQIATDISNINLKLHARAADGVTIRASEFFDKNAGKYGTYLFKFTDGSPTKLQVDDVTPNRITMKDALGSFDIKLKENLRDKLVERGYDVPDIIHTLKAEPNAKYIWPSKGNMIGSKAVSDAISPSLAGFIVAREPKNNDDKYVVLVVEGALKGVITAEYLDKPDQTGVSFGDTIAKDSGIVVAQVPGVSPAFIKSVNRIYDEYPVKGTYIAMDADGRENLHVAKGIKTSHEFLSQYSPVKVLSWDPNQKGIDDALLAVSRHEITVADMDIHYGTPEKLFPLSQAKAPNPYLLDGSRANKSEWESDYEASKAATAAKLAEAQSTTLGDGLEDALSDLKSDELSK